MAVNPTSEDSNATDPDDQLSRFKLDINNDADVMIDQRDSADADMRFINVKGGMWEGFLEGTDSNSGIRLKLEFDLISDFVQTVMTEWNLNRVGVEYKPNDNRTSKEDTDLLNGIYRADFRRHSGKIATDNAMLEAVTCGFGALKMATEFDDDEDPTNDNQHIKWVPIYNAYTTVFFDQAAQRIDKQDARWCTLLTQFTRSSFEDAFPGADVVTAYTPDTGINGRGLTTTTTAIRSSKLDIIYVATRYEIKKVIEDVFVYNNLATSEVETFTADDHELVKDELAADDVRRFVRKRTIERRTVEKTVFSGAAILESTRRVAGKWIPIVPFYAYRVYVGGAEWYRGVVRKLKDAQRLFNTQMSQLGENAASAGQEVPIFDPMQIDSDDLESIWADKNNKPYLLAKALRDDDGNIVQTGPLAYNRPAQLDASTTTLMAIVPQFISDIKGSIDQEAFNKEMSGKAINAIIKRLNMKTQPIFDNADTSIEWSGEIYQAMAADGVYTTRRMVATLGDDGTEGNTQLAQLVMDQDTGKLVEANIIRDKRFRSYADAGPQYESVREQTVEDLKGMLETLSNVPGGEQYVPVVVSVLIDNIVGTGLDPIKELNRRIMLQQGLIKPETPEDEKFLQSIQQQSQEPDPQQKLLEAASEQQQAEARNLDAKTVKDTADAKKKTAETEKIILDADIDRGRLQLDQNSQIIEQATRGLP